MWPSGGLSSVAKGTNAPRRRTNLHRETSRASSSILVLRLQVGYATSPRAFRRSTVLCQKGGPRLGERLGASSGSSVDARNLRMLLASVTIARSFMRPLHLGHSSNSIGQHCGAVYIYERKMPPTSRLASGPVEASQSQPAYLPWLDVLRFLACFLVIILHAVPSAPTGLGHAGVAVFFSISGFLIGRILIENRDLSRFYARRFLRIYPAYFTTIALFGLLTFTPVLHDASFGKLLWHNIGYYLTFTFQLSPDSSRLPLVIVWSLCVEELFYLLLPIMFQLRKNARVAIALSVIVGLLLIPQLSVLPNGSGTWFVFPLNLFFGVLLALARPQLRSGFPFVAVAALGLVIANAFTGWFHSFGPVSAVLCTATVWSLAFYDRKLPSALQPFRWMGTLSYGMYLLHLFCLSFVLRVIARLQGHPAAFRLAAIMLTTAISVIAAWLMQVAIEDPVLKLRFSLKNRPKAQLLVAALQVSLIPAGILLALLSGNVH